MIRLITLNCVVILTLSCIGLLAETSSAQEIRWHKEYGAALKEAKNKSLPLLIEFSKNHCFYCEKLEKKTFSNKVVTETIRSKFIALKIHQAYNPHPKLTEYLRIQYYPSIVLADSDGRILGMIEGFREPAPFHENLQRALAQVDNPEWMSLDYLAANKAIQKSDYGKAVSLLKHILEDGKQRPRQKQAKKLLDQIEARAAQKLAGAKQLERDGKTTDAMDEFTKLVAEYSGTQAAADARQFLARAVKTPVRVKKERTVVARELLGEASEFYRTAKHLACLDSCQNLIDNFGDLPEAEKARELRAAIRSNTEWMEKSSEELGKKYCNMLFLLAESHLKKNDRRKAMAVYQRIMYTFPGTSKAEVAQFHLRQLRGEPTVTVDYQKQNRK